MISSFILAIFSAILVMIPDPSTAELDALADKVLEGRNQRPIVSQTIQLPQYMRPDTLLILTEQPIPQHGFCLRTRWLAGIARAGEEDGAPTWWFDRRRGASAEREVALTREAEACPGTGYVRLIGTAAAHPDRAAWALARLDAYLKDAEGFTMRCTAQHPLQPECDNPARLRARLANPNPLAIIQGRDDAQIRIDSMTDLTIHYDEPGRLSVDLHRPVPF
ncbi:hypothetical protein K3175_08695 [Qipengyuania sp. GH1]|uniref:hypothetical protein n=1 Tax=Qipengyuania aestuarii TaxID=2867241 RepID=UPI001C872716|nr:hypothetical protein [Qipengyuania aestuarii]MBX7535738.1 hypothetical protein [Qipengyuania aestuarii]